MRIFRKPLQILGILTVTFGVVIAFIGIGGGVILIDTCVRKLVPPRRLLHTQIVLSVCYLFVLAWWYAEEQEHNHRLSKSLYRRSRNYFRHRRLSAAPENVMVAKTFHHSDDRM